jgi:hypothetical protein
MTTARKGLFALAAVATVLYLVRGLGGSTGGSVLTVAERILEWFGVVAKFACLAVGAFHGLRVAGRLERNNPARASWFLLALWLASFAAGQLALSYYELALHRLPPVPSAGDPPFLLGYVFMIAGGVGFVRAYRSTGFPIGSAFEHGAIALAAAVVLALVGTPLLAPVATADAPLGERIIDVAYPVLDFVALVLALVLLRVTLAFRGGKVWHVWGALNAGFIFMSAGDVLFAYLSSIKKEGLLPYVDLTLLLGYLSAALAMVLEDELLAADGAPRRSGARAG